MSCYMRHLGDLFHEVGVEPTKESRKAADRCIRALLGLEEAHCPEVWQALKPVLADAAQRTRLVQALSEQIRS